MDHDKAVQIIRALGDRNSVRWRVMWLLFKRPRTVTELSKKTGVEQSAMSHNLKKLKLAGLVRVMYDKGGPRYHMVDSTGFSILAEGIEHLIEKGWR